LDDGIQWAGAEFVQMDHLLHNTILAASGGLGQLFETVSDLGGVLDSSGHCRNSFEIHAR
jgi:hypothetical protein